jgi:ribosomal-protein-alanine N-acetyltransferase
LIETARLRLRPLQTADLDAFAAMYGDPEVMRYIGDGTVGTRVETAAWLERRIAAYEQAGRGMLAIVRRADGRVIGRCGLTDWTIEGRAEIELGYLVARDVWGEGYATEAASAVRDHAVALGIARLIALVDHGNEASRRVAERTGFRYQRDVESWPGKRTRLFTRDPPPGRSRAPGSAACAHDAALHRSSVETDRSSTATGSGAGRWKHAPRECSSGAAPARLHRRRPTRGRRRREAVPPFADHRQPGHRRRLPHERRRRGADLRAALDPGRDGVSARLDPRHLRRRHRAQSR